MAARVAVPAAALGLFSERGQAGEPPRAPLQMCAAALGFSNVDDLLATAHAWWDEWSPGTSVTAGELVALLQLLQFKNDIARRWVQDLMLGGMTRVVSLPTPPLALKEGAARARLPGPQESSASCGEERAAAETAAAREAPWPLCEPEDVGMDREALEKCRSYLRYRVGRRHFAGIVGGVVRHGRLVHFDEAGYADLEKRVPMRQDTIVRLFSMTKCIVVVAFLAYAEDPQYCVDLDDPVWKYLPCFKKVKLAPRSKAQKPRDLDTATFDIRRSLDGKSRKETGPFGPTLRHLLTHTAGLGYGPTLGDTLPPRHTDHYRIYYDLITRVHEGKVASLEQWVEELAQIPLKVKPGSYWEYSFATDVLGRVLEVISGKPLDVVVQEKVCGPLGMVDTAFEVPAEKLHRLGAWYEKRNPLDESGSPLERVPPGATYVLSEIDKAGAGSGWASGARSQVLSGGGTLEVPLDIKGGMVSTFRDYLRFLIMIRNLGELDGVRVLRRETAQLMICNQIPAATGRRAAWVFDKKGQGFSFLGQIQVQFNEKETFVEQGALRRGGNTLSSLPPGSVSSEYGWGGLGGPAFTIDPRLDLIVLSMTQTALELDHEENLRFSARRAIHAGIFGPTAGPSKVTDYPPEGHEGPKGGKLRAGLEGPAGDTELSAFLEAETQAQSRGKTLKEVVVSRGNQGHEVLDDEDLERSEQGDGESEAGAKRRPRPMESPGFKRQRLEASPQGGRARPREATPRRGADELLFSRVKVDATDGAPGAFRKARVTAVDGNSVEVITEGSWQTMNLSVGDVLVIDETCKGRPTKRAERALEHGPKDFGFLMRTPPRS